MYGGDLEGEVFLFEIYCGWCFGVMMFVIDGGCWCVVRIDVFVGEDIGVVDEVWFDVLFFYEDFEVVIIVLEK